MKCKVTYYGVLHGVNDGRNDDTTLWEEELADYPTPKEIRELEQKAYDHLIENAKVSAWIKIEKIKE